MTPGEVGDVLARINSDVRDLEEELNKQSRAGVTEVYEIRAEVTESSEALERALDILNENYGGKQ